MINIIIDTLKNDPAVTARVAADNIYPLFRLQGATMPAIVVQLVGTAPMETHDRGVDMDEHTVEVTVFGLSPLNVWKASEAVRSSLERFEDQHGIDRIRFTNQATDIFEVTDAFSVTQRYEMLQTR